MIKYLIVFISFFIISCGNDSSDDTIHFNKIVKNENGKYIIKDSGELVNGTVSVIGFSDYSPSKNQYYNPNPNLGMGEEYNLEKERFTKFEVDVIEGQFSGVNKYFIFCCYGYDEFSWKEVVNEQGISDAFNTGIQEDNKSINYKHWITNVNANQERFEDRFRPLTIPSLPSLPSLKLSDSPLFSPLLEGSDYIIKKTKFEVTNYFWSKKTENGSYIKFLDSNSYDKDYNEILIRQDSKYINDNIKFNRYKNARNDVYNLLSTSINADIPFNYKYYNGESFYDHGFERGVHVSSFPSNIRNRIIQNDFNVINLENIEWGAYFDDFQDYTQNRSEEAIKRTNLEFPSYYVDDISYPDNPREVLPEDFFKYTRIFDPRDKDLFLDKVDKIVNHFYEDVFGEHVVGYSLSRELEGFFSFYIEAHNQITYPDQIFSDKGSKIFFYENWENYELNYLRRSVETTKTIYSNPLPGYPSVAIREDRFNEGKFNFGPRKLSEAYLQTSDDYVRLEPHRFDKNDKYCHINYPNRTKIQSQELFTFLNNLKNKYGNYNEKKTSEFLMYTYNEPLEKLIKEFTVRHDLIFSEENIKNLKSEAKKNIKSTILLEEDVFVEDGVFYHTILPSYSKSYQNLENMWITNPNIDYHLINKELHDSAKNIQDDRLVNQIMYNKNGTSEGTFKEGKFYVPYKAYHDNGQVKAEGTLKNGLSDGPFKVYYENGQLRKEGTGEGGELDGPFKVYYENGQVKEEGTLKNSLYDGPFKFYYDNGQLREEGTGEGGEQDGPFKVYYENGQVQEEGTLKNGLYDGPFKFYYENGQVKEEGTYKDGELINVKEY